MSVRPSVPQLPFLNEILHRQQLLIAVVAVGLVGVLATRFLGFEFAAFPGLSRILIIPDFEPGLTKASLPPSKPSCGIAL